MLCSGGEVKQRPKERQDFYSFPDVLFLPFLIMGLREFRP